MFNRIVLWHYNRGRQAWLDKMGTQYPPIPCSVASCGHLNRIKKINGFSWHCVSCQMIDITTRWLNLILKILHFYSNIKLCFNYQPDQIDYCIEKCDWLYDIVQSKLIFLFQFILSSPEEYYKFIWISQKQIVIVYYHFFQIWLKSCFISYV